MEKLGADVYSVPPDPQTITSTFRVDPNILTNSFERFKSDVCGMGWSFEIRRLRSGLPEQIIIFLCSHPDLFKFFSAGKVNIAIEITPVNATRGPSNKVLLWNKMVDRRDIGVYTILRYDKPLVLTLSISFPTFTISDYPPATTNLTASISTAQAPVTHKVQALLHKSLEGVSELHDVHFILFTRRVRRREVGGPKVLRSNIELLSGTNEYIDTLLTGAFREGLASNSSEDLSETSVSAETYGYDSDSDLESEWDSEEERDIIGNKSLSLSSFSTTEDGQNGQPPSDDKGKGKESEPAHAYVEATHRAIQLRDTAAQTWKVLLYYLYTGEIQFNPLSSSSESLKRAGTRNSWACSPKSMYRLADKIDMVGLREVCKERIKMDLREENIVAEITSEFTSRYEDIQKMELDLLLEGPLWSPNTKREVMDAIHSAFRGGHTHAHDVLALVIENKMT